MARKKDIRIGMAATIDVQPLLKTVNGITRSQRKLTQDAASNPVKRTTSDDTIPLRTESEDNDDISEPEPRVRPKAKDNAAGSDSEGGSMSTRGDLKSGFSKGNLGKASSRNAAKALSGTKRAALHENKGQPRRGTKVDFDEEENVQDESPPKRNKGAGVTGYIGTGRSANTFSSSQSKSSTLGSQHDLFNPVVKPRTAAFGKHSSTSSQKAYGKQQGSSSKLPKKISSSAPEALSDEIPEKKFKSKGLTLPEEIEEPTPEKVLRIPEKLKPESSPVKSEFKAPCKLSPVKDDRPAFKTYKHTLPDSFESVSEDHKSIKQALELIISAQPRLSSSQTAAGTPFDDSILDDDEDLAEDSFIEAPFPTRISICPLCGEEVEKEFLDSFSGGKRMKLSLQTKFCRAHKRKRARLDYEERGYPTVDWGVFDKRINAHHAYLQSLLDGNSSSHYRDVLAETVKAGKNRTLQQGIFGSESGDSLTPGYYGTRGLRAMSENIMGKFSPLLRQIAPKDRLVSARGVTGYVQGVLVKELAVRLIEEDLRIETEAARKVLAETAEMGDLVNEELAEVVVRVTDDKDVEENNDDGADYA